MSLPASAPGSGTGIERVVTILNKRGLHARAAAKFVKLAAQFAAELTVTKDGVSVSGRSIMGLMMLAAFGSSTGTVWWSTTTTSTPRFCA